MNDHPESPVPSRKQVLRGKPRRGNVVDVDAGARNARPRSLQDDRRPAFEHAADLVVIGARPRDDDPVDVVPGEQTRTALARVVLPNSGGNLRPGLFVTGTITVKSVAVPLLVPKSALQTIGEKETVFVMTQEGFVPRTVTIGRSNDTHVEVISGMKPGERYAASGAFTLKAQLSKGAFGDSHGH